MGNLKLYYINKLDNPVTLAATSEAANFPATNVQQRWTSRGWRSNYGVGSGGGTFVITVSDNDELYFEENNTTPAVLNGTITAGTYNAETLAVEIKTQMEAAGANTYTVAYDETNFKFTIDILTGTNFKLIGAGTDAIDDTIGFDGVDTAFITTWTADEIRIHTSETITFNYAAGELWELVLCLGLNLTVAGVIQVEFSADNFATAAPISQTMIQNTDKYLGIYVPASITYDDIRFIITDPANSDGYVTIGRTWAGVEDLVSNVGVSPKRGEKVIDPSVVKFSDGRQPSVIERTKYLEWDFDFQSIEDYETFKALVLSRGYSKEMVMLIRPSVSNSLAFTTPEDYIRYCRMKSFPFEHRAGTNWTGKVKMVEEL